MNLFKKWLNRIPDRWQSRIHQYGPWVVLVLSVVLIGYADSKKSLDSFRAFTTRQPARDAAVTLGYIVGYLTAGLVRFPQRIIPLLAVLWSLAVLHYRYLFVPLAVRSGWLEKVGYGVLLLIGWWAFVAGLTAWLGFDQISAGIVNGWLVYALLFAYTAYFRRLRKTRHQLTEQTTRAELNALKAQINPHFLFNSLNNIFGTALTENGPRTADSVQQLSRLLRYMLEQSNTDRASVGDELQFLDEYVMLQKQRLTNADAAGVQFTYDWDEEPAQVAPLLLSPLLDYAFRRSAGAKNDGSGFLRATAVVQNRQLQFSLDYTCPAGPAQPADELQNVQQRLNLIYPNRHYFTLSEADTTAHLDVTINLN